IRHGSAVAHERWRAAAVDDQDILHAAVPDVAPGSAASGSGNGKRGPGFLGDLLKCTVLLIVEELGPLPEMYPASAVWRRIYLGHHMPIRNEDIQPAIVVIIEKPSSKPQILNGRRTNAGLVANIREQSSALVLEQVVGLVLKIRDEERE